MKRIYAIIALFIGINLYADEGMWMLGNLNKETRKALKELGLKLSPDKLYNEKKPALSNAIVSFGGFCSGVVVSSDGLVFTNHHCGFSAIQQHSSVGNDLLENGFVAKTRQEELPNPELYVRFLLKTEDVTKRVLAGLTDAMNEQERGHVTDSIKYAIESEVHAKDSTLIATVDTYYGGNEFWLSVYRDYDDVRLVFAPPSSIGKFGWDTDNWEWPRHTGDFSVFRIYADKNNQPAEYSPDNVPYHPQYVAPVSTAGYQEGSFCMTLGYPGSTDRYISSYGVQEQMEGQNQAMIDVRGVKQAIWKREMDKREDIRIKYASKYDESSNYWKYSIGMNKALNKLDIIGKKQEMEKKLMRWIQSNPDEREKLLHLLTSLELGYKDRKETSRAMSYLGEAFANGPELVQLALQLLNFNFDDDPEVVRKNTKGIYDKYADLDLNIDREVFVAMLKEYRDKIDKAYLPDFYLDVDTAYNGNYTAYVDSLYAHTKLSTTAGLELLMAKDTTYHFFNDPATSIAIDLIVKAYEMNQSVMDANMNIARSERLYNAAIRRMYADRNYYPDANSTMRLSFGTVGGYMPRDGIEYNYYTTTRGILEKNKAHAGDRDFKVQPEILDILSAGNFGRYAGKSGEMNVCFISNNDITGGNSGSAMFNAHGELLGLAFDGNWEAMSSDLVYEPELQKCIGVDVRYMLFVMEKVGHAAHLLKELDLK